MPCILSGGDITISWAELPWIHLEDLNRNMPTKLLFELALELMLIKPRIKIMIKGCGQICNYIVACSTTIL